MQNRTLRCCGLRSDYGLAKWRGPRSPPAILIIKRWCIRYVNINKADGRLEDHNIFLVTKSIESYASAEKVWSNRNDGSLTVALKEKYAKRIVEHMKSLGLHSCYGKIRHQAKHIKGSDCLQSTHSP